MTTEKQDMIAKHFDMPSDEPFDAASMHFGDGDVCDVVLSDDFIRIRYTTKKWGITSVKIPYSRLTALMGVILTMTDERENRETETSDNGDDHDDDSSWGDDDLLPDG